MTAARPIWRPTASSTPTTPPGVYSVTEIVSGTGGSSTNTQVNYVTVLTPFQAWQVKYFGSTTNPAAAASADPDGDGQNNLAEFLAGTNPTNSASGLRITSVTRQGSDMLVTWTTARWLYQRGPGGCRFTRRLVFDELP